MHDSSSIVVLWLSSLFSLLFLMFLQTLFRVVHRAALLPERACSVGRSASTRAPCAISGRRSKLCCTLALIPVLPAPCRKPFQFASSSRKPGVPVLGHARRALFRARHARVFPGRLLRKPGENHGARCVSQKLSLALYVRT